MLNKGAFFTCSKCLAVAKIAFTSTSKVLQAPCQGVGRRLKHGLNNKAHAQVAAEQNQSIVGVLAKPSVAVQLPPSEDVEPLRLTAQAAGQPAQPQQKAEATPKAKTQAEHNPQAKEAQRKPKAKSSTCGKPKPSPRPSELKQKLLSFTK